MIYRREHFKYFLACFFSPPWTDVTALVLNVDQFARLPVAREKECRLTCHILAVGGIPVG